MLDFDSVWPVGVIRQDAINFHRFCDRRDPDIAGRGHASSAQIEVVPDSVIANRTVVGAERNIGPCGVLRYLHLVLCISCLKTALNVFTVHVKLEDDQIRSWAVRQTVEISAHVQDKGTSQSNSCSPPVCVTQCIIWIRGSDSRSDGLSRLIIEPEDCVR